MRPILLLAALLSLPMMAGAAQARQEPRTAEEFHERGLQRLRSADVDGALRDFGRAVELRPDFADAYFARSFAWNTKEQAALVSKDRAAAFAEITKARDAAWADLDKAVELDPERAEFRKQRGVYRLRFAAEPEDHDAAIADFDKAAALTPGDAQLYFLRASTRMLKDDFAGALRDFDRAVALAPAEVGYLGARGWLKLAFLADYPGAESDADAAIRLGGAGAYEWYATRGKARQLQGRKIAGARDLQTCRRLSPRCAATLRKLDMLLTTSRRTPQRN